MLDAFTFGVLVIVGDSPDENAERTKLPSNDFRDAFAFAPPLRNDAYYFLKPTECNCVKPLAVAEGENECVYRDLESINIRVHSWNTSPLLNRRQIDPLRDPQCYPCPLIIVRTGVAYGESKV